MNKLKEIRLRMLLSELDFTEISYEYTKEIIAESDISFIESVNDFLDKHSKLKKVYNRRYNDAIDKNIKNQKAESDKIKESIKDKENNLEEENDEEIKNEIIIRDEPLMKVKKLYREIAKLTHPDKVDNKKMNSIYIEATRYYDSNDKLGIYKICNKLNINYELDEDDNSVIEFKISDLKNKIRFMESTFTWKWINSKTEEEKDSILFAFVKIKISK